VKKVSILSIGDELLNGQVLNTNAYWLSQRLSDAGFEVGAILTCPDIPSAIKSQLQWAQSTSDIILMTGGLGPTDDDMTVETVADFLQLATYHDTQVEQDLQAFFMRRGITHIPSNNFKQCQVIEGANVLRNSIGTAPGLWIQQGTHTYIIMPGVPFEMKEMFSHQVLPQLSQEDNLEIILNEYIMTIGKGESHMAELIRDIETSMPAYIHLAYLPRMRHVLLRLTGRHNDKDLLYRELSNIRHQLIERLKEWVIGYEDKRLDAYIVDFLKKNKWCIATAESCTGGQIAAQFVQNNGVSEVFMGGIVAYDNTVKVAQLQVNPQDLSKYGAVSEIVARQMAEGVKAALHTDFAIATTGIAGPTGGTPEKPVGTVWIAIARPQGETITRKYHFNYDRMTNIEFTTQVAFVLFIQQVMMQQ